MSKISSFTVEGLMAPTFTPMKADGTIVLDKIGPYIDYLVSKDVTQVYVNGSTAETYSLTLPERKEILEKWMAESKGRMTKIIAQIGAMNMFDSQELARHAASLGVDAIAAVPPFAFTPKTIDALVDYCRNVAAAAPNLPFYYYHIPKYSGVNLCMDEFLEKARSRIPSLVGMKFSSPDVGDLLGCCNVEVDYRNNKRFNMLFGSDNAWSAGLNFGADGGICTLFNFCPRLCQRMYQNVKKGDMAAVRQDQLRAQKVQRIIVKYGAKFGANVAPSKYIMQILGMDFGAPRCPLKVFEPEDVEQLKADLTEIGFFDWCE